MVFNNIYLKFLYIFIVLHYGKSYDAQNQSPFNFLVEWCMSNWLQAKEQNQLNSLGFKEK
jgi:hypothetical protein